MSSIRDALERVRKRREMLTQDVRSTVNNLTETLPRPVFQTLGREPPLKQARRWIKRRQQQ